jgi:hypothetical protein
VSLSNFERYERIAWAYDLLDLPFEYGRYRKIRPLLFRGLSGRILEAGIGTGRNFPSECRAFDLHSLTLVLFPILRDTLNGTAPAPRRALLR